MCIKNIHRGAFNALTFIYVYLHRFTQTHIHKYILTYETFPKIPQTVPCKRLILKDFFLNTLSPKRIKKKEEEDKCNGRSLIDLNGRMLILIFKTLSLFQIYILCFFFQFLFKDLLISFLFAGKGTFFTQLRQSNGKNK